MGDGEERERGEGESKSDEKTGRDKLTQIAATHCDTLQHTATLCNIDATIDRDRFTHIHKNTQNNDLNISNSCKPRSFICMFYEYTALNVCSTNTQP